MDKYILHKLVLTKRSMKNKDFTGLYYMYVIQTSLKKNNGQSKLFFSEVETFTNFYAFSIGFGGSYSHKFITVELSDMVHFDGIITIDIIIGVYNGGFFRRWIVFDASYDNNIVINMKYTRFIQINQTLKLNNNQTLPEIGDVGYNPAFK